jgi:hypothetical protein
VENAGRLARAAPARPETVEEAAMSSLTALQRARVVRMLVRRTAQVSTPPVFVAGGARRRTAARIVVGARLVWITCTGSWRESAAYGGAPLGYCPDKILSLVCIKRVDLVVTTRPRSLGCEDARSNSYVGPNYCRPERSERFGWSCSCLMLAAIKSALYVFFFKHEEPN